MTPLNRAQLLTEDDYLAKVEQYRKEILEACAEQDDRVMQHYLDGKEPTEAELIAFSRETLPGFKAPSEIEFGELPKTSTRKVRRNAVLDELKRRGHKLESEAVGAYGGYQAIWRDSTTGMYAGATEKRKIEYP